MTDPLEAVLRQSPLTNSQRADVWDAYEGSADSDALAERLQALNVPKQVKASLWDLKEQGAPKVTAPPEEAFPTPGETARTMIGSGLRSIPGMAYGMLKAATDPLTLPMREAAALATGAPSPSMEQAREMAGHARAALAPGDAGPGRRMAEAASVVPGVAPVVEGAETIMTPAYKTATEGVGSVKPAEMRAAAESGGRAVAGLAIPELAKYGSKIPPAAIGNVLKFSARMAAERGLAPGASVAGKVVAHFAGPAMRAFGTIIQDQILEAVRTGNLTKATEAVARGIEKHPEAAAEIAATIAEDTARAAAPAKAPLPRMRDTSPEAIAARTADRNARQQAAARGERVLAPIPPDAPVPQAAPAEAPAPAARPAPTRPPGANMTEAERAEFRQRFAARLTPEQARAALAQRIADAQARRAAAPAPVETTTLPTAIVERAAETLEKRAKMPEKGNVKLPTVYTKPNGKKGPIGQPLTPRQREVQIKQLEAAKAAGIDIWDLFPEKKD